MKSVLTTATLFGLLAADPAAAQMMEISSPAARATMPGPVENFTGQVKVTPLYPANENMSSGGGLVVFEPKARSAWHTHPAGQVLIVTTGKGWVQEEGQPKRQIVKGDVVWTPPGVKHWHGASDDEGMSHIAITNVKDGRNAEWMEKVTGEQFAK